MTGLGQSISSRRTFFTGEPGCGKSTVLKRSGELLSRNGLKVGGMLTSELREHGTRIGFRVEDFITHEQGMLASVRGNEGPRLGKYTMNLRDLDRIGVGAIRRAIEAADVILIDEIGPMELHSSRFVESVRTALNSPKHLLGTIHKRATHPLVLEIKSNPDITCLEVTMENRELLPADIAEKIIGTK
jgi:nucleoside-triphosphatase